MVGPKSRIDDKVMRMAAVRACGAIRQLDRWARGIDVTIHPEIAAPSSAGDSSPPS